jgi:hypothetical protein
MGTTTNDSPTPGSLEASLSRAPAAKVVRPETKIVHRYIATLPAENFQKTAPVSLQKPAMEGIESSSQDPFNMTATKVVRKNTTSLREIVKAEKRKLSANQENGSDQTTLTEDENGMPVPSFFPLEYFDDKTFETRTMEEWMQSNDGQPVEARSLWHFGDGTSEWKEVMVLEISTNGEQFLIQWKHNNKQKWAGRLNVCFQEESLEKHQKRREQALNNRSRIEAFMRYERSIDLMPTEKQLQLTPTQFHCIVRRIGMRVSGDHLRRNQELVEDVLYHHCRTVNKMDYDAANPEADASKRVDPIEEHGRKQLPIQIHKIPGRGTISTVPVTMIAALDRAAGEGAEPLYELEGEQAHFRSMVVQVEKSLPWAPPHMLATLFAFQTQITRLNKVSFMWDCSEPVELSTFKDRHVACWKKGIEEITTTMMESMSDSLLLAYTTEESQLGHPMTVEARAKYTRTVELANKMLSDAVRNAIARSIQTYTERMETYLRPRKPAPEDSESSLTAGNWFGEEETLPEDLTLGVRADNKSIFLVDLKYDESGTLVLEPGPEQVEHTAASVIHDLVEATKQIVSFQVEVINARPQATHLNPCEGPDFENMMKECVERVRASVQDNSFGPKSLVREFEKYPFLIETNVDKYVDAWHEACHPLMESKEEIQRFLAAADAVMARFASEVVLRMYLVSVADSFMLCILYLHVNT